MTLQEKTARALSKYLENNAFIMIDGAAYAQVLFYPSNSLEEDKKFESCATIINNSKVLYEFTFDEETTERYSKDFPVDVNPITKGFILLYVPPGTKRYKGEMSVGPTDDEVYQFRRLSRVFMAGYNAGVLDEVRAQTKERRKKK